VGAPALFVVLWSTGFVFAKEGVKHAEPMTLVSLRFAIATALSLLLVLGGRAVWLDRRTFLHVAVVGLLLQAAYVGGVFAAIDHGLPAGIAALIVGVQPLLSACLVGPMLGERVAVLQWLGFMLGLAGVCLVLVDKLTFDGATAAGLLLVTLALVGGTFATLYQKRFCGHADVRSACVVQYGVACLATLAFALPLETNDISWTPAFVGTLAWMAVVLSIGTVSLLLLIIRHGEATRTASLFYLVPPVTALMAYFWFDETLGAIAMAGMAVAVAGVALVQRRAPARA
jgi:drug/metabolite transporter (DMT)-like permease